MAAIVLVVLSVGSFTFFPAFYSEYLPSAIASPILQTRDKLLTFVVDSTSSMSVTSLVGGTPAANAGWVTRFFATVNQARRGPPLVPCPALNSFAKYRFDDMTQGKNYEISHYNFGNDFQSYYGESVSGSFGEEYFFTDGYTPSNFASHLEDTASFHWQGLLDSGYGSYGYYLGKGPVIQYVGFEGSCNSPTEVLGEGVNMTQIGSGCILHVSNETWLVIELANACP